MSASDEVVRAVRTELGRDLRPRRSATRAVDVVRMEDVWLSFDHDVLRGLTFHLRKGETLLVAGRSGAGKSTILKLILRLLVPNRGRIEVLGQEVTRLSFARAQRIRRRVGMVFQNAALFDSLTVYENVAFPLRETTSLPEVEVERIVRERLRFVDLNADRVMGQLPAELSGGMQKRVGIARAIATEPELLLYDEPTAGLDPIAVKTILRLIRKLQVDLGVSSVLVTHDLRYGFQVASRVNVLRRGRIVFDGTPEDMVATEDEFLRAFLG